MVIKLRAYEIRPTVVVPVEEPEDTDEADEAEEQQNETVKEEPII